MDTFISSKLSVVMATPPNHPSPPSPSPASLGDGDGGLGEENLYLKFSKLHVFSISSSSVCNFKSMSTSEMVVSKKCIHKKHYGDSAICSADATHSPDKSSEKISESVNHDLVSPSKQFPEKTLMLYSALDKHGIQHETVAYKPKQDRDQTDTHLTYCKNLFLKDRKGKYFLVTCHEDIDIDLKQLRKDVKAYRNFSFGTESDMEAILKTKPGGVTPFSLMFETAADVTMVISNTVTSHDAILMFHPLDPSLATKISLQSLILFLKQYGHQPQFVQ